VFDSPCKTAADIDFALRQGVAINANSYAEVEKIATALQALSDRRIVSTSVIGLRVNPMVGAGKIAALSTATATSKFGVPCCYADEPESLGARPDLREKIISTYLKYPFLRAIMCHVGSQGMPLALMVDGARCLFELADEIDDRCRAAAATGGDDDDDEEDNDDRFGGSSSRYGRSRRSAGSSSSSSSSKHKDRITHIDIGGGLSANYNSDEVSPTFEEYCELLAQACSEMHQKKPKRILVTEFGKALVAKTAIIATVVEEVTEMEASLPAAATAASAGTAAAAAAVAQKPVMAVVQAGADLLLRTCYAPEKFPHRLAFLNSHKQPLHVVTSSSYNLPVAGGSKIGFLQVPVWGTSDARPPCALTVAGPLCFSGDVLAQAAHSHAYSHSESSGVLHSESQAKLDPELVRGDVCLVLDAGANTLSLFSRHCSRPSPPVFAFRQVRLQQQQGQGQGQGQGQSEAVEGVQFAVSCIRSAETEKSVLEFWD
jgi:diaminopimelate decarboxylase